MKLIFKLVLIIIVVMLALPSCSGAIDRVMNHTYDKGGFVFLVVGFDDAAENTDVLFTVNYNKNENSIKIAQIPRDTYFNFGSSQNKINQFYATMRVKGYDKKEALKRTSDAISSAFGTEFDGFLGITTNTFKKIVESIGGVDIELSSDMTIAIDGEPTLSLKSGSNHINGNEATVFVRYRSGYAGQDLGRIDAQKIFLEALFRKITSGISLPSIFSLVAGIQSDAVTDVQIIDIVKIVLGGFNKERELTKYFVTVPGEAIQSAGGLSYYVLQKYSAEKIARKYMYANKEFDPEGRFCNSSEVAFENVYRDSSENYKEYSDEDIKDIRISLTNNK